MINITNSGKIYEENLICSIENPQFESDMQFSMGKTIWETIVNAYIYGQQF